MTFDDLKFYELFQKFRFRNELLMNYMNFPGLCVLYSSLKFFLKKIRNMHALLPNQIVDSLYFNDNASCYM